MIAAAIIPAVVLLVGMLRMAGDAAVAAQERP